MKTRKLALNAVLAAMCAALGALALDLHIHSLPGNGKRNERRASVPKPAHALKL